MRINELGKDIGIHCKTEDEAMILLTVLESMGYKWNSGGALTDDTNFEEYGADTAYFIWDVPGGHFGVTYNDVPVSYTHLTLPTTPYV